VSARDRLELELERHRQSYRDGPVVRLASTRG